MIESMEPVANCKETCFHCDKAATHRHNRSLDNGDPILPYYLCDRHANVCFKLLKAFGYNIQDKRPTPRVSASQ